MAAFNNDGTNEDDDMMKAKSDKNEKLSSGNADDFLVKIFKLKESSTEKGTIYNCEECGQKMMNQSSLNTHIRSIHEGIKYPCGQCDYLSVTNSRLHLHRRSGHVGMKYPCGQCHYQAATNSSMHH